MVEKEVLIELAEAVRCAVLTEIDTPAGRRVAGVADSGDATFGIDEVAEGVVAGFIEQRLPEVAYYTEDKGLRVPPEGAGELLVLDPIDGSRPARAGLEACVVSIARAPYAPGALLGDVDLGVVMGLRDGTLFCAERGQGAEFYRDGRGLPIHLRQTGRIEEMAWTAEIVARPAKAVVEVLAPLIDASAMAGGFFVLNSTAYSLTRLVSGQLDAVVDIGGRLREDFPELEESFLGAGGGRVVALFPYDIAAALLIAVESGCAITDARGQSLGAKPLLDNSERNLLSLVAAANPGLHGLLLEGIEAGFRRLLQSGPA
jgi:myo-inositol-1(or 4)-monophosphatase